MIEGGRIENVHIAGTTGGPVRAVAAVEALPGIGLAGDRNHRQDGEDKPGRDLTLIEAENIEYLARDHGIELAPGETRRNVTTRGVRLNELVGKEFWIGSVLARATEVCEPCTHLVALTGKPVIKPLTHRGGLRADLLSSGRINLGDAVRVKA